MNRRTFQWTTVAVAVAVMGTFNVAYADIDVTGVGAEVVQDGAVYIQGPLPTSAGTGLIDPFLTVGGTGVQAITSGYNTDGTAEFDTVTGGDRTHSLNLAAVPEQEYDGVIYKEFVLDINKAPGGSPYLALNELELFLTTDPNITGYPFGLTPIFDLDAGPDGDLAILMDYSLESGSGASDLTWLVPLDVFDGDLGDCNYGNPACTTYVVMYNQYGSYVGPDGDVDKWVNNDGFEEWGTVLRPVVNVTKNAAGTYNRTIDWTIVKSVDPNSHDLFAGGAAGTSGYSITVTKSDSVDSIAAGGTITILNPTGGEGNPIEEDINAEILSVDDVITQGEVSTDAIVDCGVSFPYTLNAGDFLTCTYEAFPGSPANGVNEATVEIEALFDTSTYSGTADLAFTETVIGYDEINVDDTNPGGDFGPVGATFTHTYSRSFDCADVTYVNGVATYQVPNTATIVETDENSSANVTVNCYAPVVTKNVGSSPFNREYQWEITKDYDATYDKFIGDPATSHGYLVTVDRLDATIDTGYRVEGSIFIVNNRPDAAMILTSVSDSVDGVSAVVICPSLVVLASDQLECTYDTGEESALDGTEDLNTATVVFNSISYGAEASFTYEVGTETNAEVNVTDTNGESWTASGDDSWTYSRDFECSRNPADYTGGFDTFDTNNTATIDETGQSDDATVTVNCYAPVPSKNAKTEYIREFTWTIEKSVDPDSHEGFLGDSFTSDYEVSVVRTLDEYGFSVYGTITVVNPNPGAPMTVSVADSVNGTPATLDCGGTLLVPAGGSNTCGYSASLLSKTDGTNTATVSLNSIGFGATADYDFGDPTEVIGPDEINVTDYFDGDLVGDPLGSTSVDFTFEYEREFVCSEDEGMYTDGRYTEDFPNYAEIDETGDQDDANVDLTCLIPASAKVIKLTTEGSEDIGQFPFEFELYDPSDDLVETQTLDGEGNVTFDADLLAEGTWTVKEILPDGWVSEDDSLECTFDVAYPGSAGQTYTCEFDNTEMSRVDLVKLTNGVYRPDQTWSFELYDGPDGFCDQDGKPEDCEAIAADGTPADPDGLLTFGDTNLDPNAIYTLCELGVPAGYSSLWVIDNNNDGVIDGGDTVVLPYDPNEDDAVPEDTGHRCVDFGAGTTMPTILLVPGETLHFIVDNQMPGGAPRTPGYWKNWNRCTGGGQQYTADANGGWLEGFWLVEDVLNPLIGGGIAWGDFVIDLCEVAVDILDDRFIEDPEVVGDGRKTSKYADHTLAKHLLAYQLNQGAGACVPTGNYQCVDSATAMPCECDSAPTCATVYEHSQDAEALLVSLPFNLTESGKLRPKGPTKDLYWEALELAWVLDLYNNGAYCGDTME